MTTLCSKASANPTKLITDFPRGPGSLEWFVVSDNVMGGKSSGGFELSDGNLVFTGSTNTRGGGFSPIRSRGPRMDLSEFSGIRLRARSTV